MPTENNTAITWTFESATYFLRDDEAAGICDYVRYSLFRLIPSSQDRHVLHSTPTYGRVRIRCGTLEALLPYFHQDVRHDCLSRGCDVDPVTVFRDERE